MNNSLEPLKQKLPELFVNRTVLDTTSKYKRSFFNSRYDHKIKDSTEKYDVIICDGEQGLDMLNYHLHEGGHFIFPDTLSCTMKKPTQNNYPVLSIMIATMHKRAEQFRRLMAVLGGQLTGEVELLTDIDNGEKTIGSKRQNLLNRAGGQYVCYVDDDDIVSADYVSELLQAINKTKPDCVGFWYESCCMATGHKRTVEVSLHTKAKGIKEEILTHRYTNHLTPVKRDIALQVGFEDISVNEDNQYSRGVVKIARTEWLINKVLYYYQSRHGGVS